MNLFSAIRKSIYLQHDKRVLVAVSGGPDSVALLHALFRYGLDCVLAHCNFHLRGEESDDDARFVESLAETYNFPFCKIDFDTVAEAECRGVSIEMAARDLRYRWFERMADEWQCHYIAVAHNADDNIETFLLNVLRGTGIRGVSGMVELRGRVLRPLLKVSRDEIMAYIAQNELDYRIDKTNAETVYLRNKLRHEVIPVLKQINPSLLDTMQNNFENLSSVAELFDDYAERQKSLCVGEKPDGVVVVDAKRLLSLSGAEAILFEWIMPYRFSSPVVRQLYRTLCEGGSGQKFHSSTHSAVISRGTIEIVPLSEFGNEEYRIDCDCEEIAEPLALDIKHCDIADFEMIKDKKVACLDADKLRYPLTLRRWKRGDRFAPFGMNGTMKVSDYFNNRKFSAIDKQNTWLLCSGDEIVWIVGHRISRHFAITESSKNVKIIKMR